MLTNTVQPTVTHIMQCGAAALGLFIGCMRDAVRLHTIALHVGNLQRCIHHGTTLLESAFNVKSIR